MLQQATCKFIKKRKSKIGRVAKQVDDFAPQWNRDPLASCTTLRGRHTLRSRSSRTIWQKQSPQTVVR